MSADSVSNTALARGVTTRHGGLRGGVASGDSGRECRAACAPASVLPEPVRSGGAKRQLGDTSSERPAKQVRTSTRSRVQGASTQSPFAITGDPPERRPSTGTRHAHAGTQEKRAVLGAPRGQCGSCTESRARRASSGVAGDAGTPRPCEAVQQQCHTLWIVQQQSQQQLRQQLQLLHQQLLSLASWVQHPHTPQQLLAFRRELRDLAAFLQRLEQQQEAYEACDACDAAEDSLLLCSPVAPFAGESFHPKPSVPGDFF